MTLGRAQFVVIAVVVTITTLVVTITTVSVRLTALGLPLDLSLESSLPFLGLTVGILIASEWVRRVITTTREGAYFRIRIAEGRLTMYRPGWHRTPDVDVDLTSVRHIHWYVSAFSRQQTVRITLWDRPTTFTLEAIDIRPDDPDAQQLGWFRAPDLLLQPAEHRRFVEHFEALVISGQVSTTVDLHTLQPTHANADDTAPGWLVLDDKLTYSPHVAETQRRMRSE